MCAVLPRWLSGGALRWGASVAVPAEAQSGALRSGMSASGTSTAKANSSHIGRSGKSIDSSESGRRWRYQSSWSWTVTSTLVTQLARLYMRSQQRPAPRHQAAFGAAPEPMSETVRLWRLRERSG